MISTLLLLTCLRAPDQIDECLNYLEEARKLGLPVTKEERMLPKPSAETLANQKRIKSLDRPINLGKVIEEDFKQAKNPKSTTPGPPAKPDFSMYLPIADKLVKSKAPYWALSRDPMAFFPYHAKIKAFVKAETEDALVQANKGNFDKVIFRMTNARILSTTAALQEDFIGVMVARACQAIYVATLEKIQVQSPKQFYKLPATLLSEFQPPDFKRLLRSDFAATFDLLAETKETLTRKYLAKSAERCKMIRIFAKNWVICYPELRGAINWTNLQTAFLNVAPELEVMKSEDEEMSFTPAYASDIAKLDERDAKQIEKLQKLRRLRVK